MSKKRRRLISSMVYNVLLITLGSIVIGIGIKAITLPHSLITGGI